MREIYRQVTAICGFSSVMTDTTARRDRSESAKIYPWTKRYSLLFTSSLYSDAQHWTHCHTLIICPWKLKKETDTPTHRHTNTASKARLSCQRFGRALIWSNGGSKPWFAVLLRCQTEESFAWGHHILHINTLWYRNTDTASCIFNTQMHSLYPYVSNTASVDHICNSPTISVFHAALLQLHEKHFEFSVSSVTGEKKAFSFFTLRQTCSQLLMSCQFIWCDLGGGRGLIMVMSETVRGWEEALDMFIDLSWNFVPGYFVFFYSK